MLELTEVYVDTMQDVAMHTSVDICIPGIRWMPADYAGIDTDVWRAPPLTASVDPFRAQLKPGN